MKTCWKPTRSRVIPTVLVCVDETSKQLIVETRKPIPDQAGTRARHDYEYERNGVAIIHDVCATGGLA